MNSLHMTEAKKIVEQNWPFISPYCAAIYLGGSQIDPVIENPHDYDFILFAKDLPIGKVLFSLNNFIDVPFVYTEEEFEASEENPLIFDFSQIKVYPYNRITFASYLDIYLEKIIGEEVRVKTDIIYKHRDEYIQVLKTQKNMLLDGTIENQKRWYHILRGIYILKNNSYDVTEEQKREINILHDLSEGWEAVRDKTIKLLITIQ